MFLDRFIRYGLVLPVLLLTGFTYSMRENSKELKAYNEHFEKTDIKFEEMPGYVSTLEKLFNELDTDEQSEQNTGFGAKKDACVYAQKSVLGKIGSSLWRHKGKILIVGFFGAVIADKKFGRDYTGQLLEKVRNALFGRTETVAVEQPKVDLNAPKLVLEKVEIKAEQEPEQPKVEQKFETKVIEQSKIELSKVEIKPEQKPEQQKVDVKPTGDRLENVQASMRQKAEIQSSATTLSMNKTVDPGIFSGVSWW
jgi:hypothetical protein